MEIQIANNRPAFTQAVRLAKQEEEPLLPQWEADTTKMVVEVSRKFFGSLTAETVRKGLDATVGILSLGLFHATAGSVDPEAWLAKLRATGVKGVSKTGVDLIKECDAMPETDFVLGDQSVFGTSTRELLLDCAKKGYPYLMAKMLDRRTNQLAVNLANWMLQHSSVGRVVKKEPASTVGNDAFADDVFFYILARECGVSADKLPSEDDPDPVIRLGPKLRKTARDRYDAFVAKIPADLKPGLFYNGKSWFDRKVELIKSSEKPPKAAQT